MSGCECVGWSRQGPRIQYVQVFNRKTDPHNKALMNDWMLCDTATTAEIDYLCSAMGLDIQHAHSACQQPTRAQTLKAHFIQLNRHRARPKKNPAARRIHLQCISYVYLIATSYTCIIRTAIKIRGIIRALASVFYDCHISYAVCTTIYILCSS